MGELNARRIHTLVSARSELFFRNHAVVIGVQPIEPFRSAFPFVARNHTVVISVHLPDPLPTVKTALAPDTLRVLRVLSQGGGRKQKSDQVGCEGRKSFHLHFPPRVLMFYRPGEGASSLRAVRESGSPESRKIFERRGK